MEIEYEKLKALAAKYELNVYSPYLTYVSENGSIYQQRDYLFELTHMQAWLRNKHNLIVEINLDQTSNIKYAYDIIKWHEFANFERKTNVLEWGLYRTYEQCLQAALTEAINYV